ncbi:hypothetical protein SLEP1_g22563 [Rubroshorea leprosula]|uniref:Retrotransposon gag domain-containing protein n=1 Tax=Rubroshorea leprosula TaxID=152421 RepID=A0AAV5JIU1_9ROSI|nr:hypothetical protein SLEP1_g22563 [Rubroshorea leprosula]
MANKANLEKGALENRVENMENTLKELMASFQSLQATLVIRAPLATNPLFEENVSMANLLMATSTLTLGKEPTSSYPPNPTIGGTFGTKPFDLNAGVATVQLMKETLKLMQGVQTNKPIDISSLCFFPNIQLPHKFKLPEFDKYNGTGCPYTHLMMYCRKMAPYANDEKLMIHYFQDSLAGLIDAWFSTLDKSKVKSWHDLTHNFMKQYEYNTSLDPSRKDLQKIEKKPSESFKKFEQRWHGLAAQVQPPLTDHELMEDGIKFRIIMDYQAMKSILEQYQNDSSKVSSPKKVGQNRKKENGNGTISSVYEAYNQSRGQFNNRFEAQTYQSTAFTSQSRPVYASGTSHPQQEEKRCYFDKLLISYIEVFRQLIAARLVTPVPMVPLNPPFPIWYNPQVRCEYHSGGVGHDLENCLALKHCVQDLIDAKELQITSELEVVGPNITKNPLPTHDGPTINMIKKDSDKGMDEDKVILPAHGESLDNGIVEILPIPIIKS